VLPGRQRQELTSMDIPKIGYCDLSIWIHMKKEDLLTKAKELKIPESLYSIDGKRIAAGLIMEKYNEREWIVYHFDDHGRHENEDRFLYEEQAYDYLFELMKKLAIYFEK
jgi:hypothetical protein